MGRINVPAGGGKREKTLLNGKSFGEFINTKAQGYEFSGILGKSEDDEYLVLRAKKSSNEDQIYALIYNKERVLIADFQINKEDYACFVDSDKHVICVNKSAVFTYRFNGDTVFRTGLLSSEGRPLEIDSASFFNGMLYMCSFFYENGKQYVYFAKHNKFGELYYEKKFEHNKHVKPARFWLMNELKEGFLFAGDHGETFFFDFKTEQFSSKKPTNHSPFWAFGEVLPSSSGLKDLEIFKELQKDGYDFYTATGMTFWKEENKYIYCLRMYQPFSDFMACFKIDADSLEDFEVVPLFTKGKSVRDPILFNGYLLYETSVDGYTLEFLSL